MGRCFESGVVVFESVLLIIFSQFVRIKRIIAPSPAAPHTPNNPSYTNPHVTPFPKTVIMKATLIASAALFMAGSAYGAAQTTFPSAAGTVVSDKPITVTGTFDGGMKRYNRQSGYCSGQSEGGSADTMFLLQNGATLQNVIIGADQVCLCYCL